MATIDNNLQSAISNQRPAVAQCRVWDLPVRLFHWTLMASIIGAFVTNKLGVRYFEYHVWCGYAVIVLVLFRLLWGIVGTRHARFLNFVRGPIVTLRYAFAVLQGRAPRYRGHNPLGAWMVVVMLSALLVQSISGLFSNDEIFNFGPLVGYVGKDFSLQLTSLHRQLFFWIMGAITLHILAVIAHQLFKRENLTKAMITGRKQRDCLGEEGDISSSRLWLAVLIVLGLSVGLGEIIKHAPTPDEYTAFE